MFYGWILNTSFSDFKKSMPKHRVLHVSRELAVAKISVRNSEILEMKMPQSDL